MRIAVTYDNNSGTIFQHFGRSENFKVYEIEEGKVVSSQVIGSDGKGHGALAGLLSENTIDVLICGGIGGGAQNALASYGIGICAGASGDADQAVEAYLKGELKDAGVTCNHHGEGHTCGHHEEGGCDHHDEGGGCCGHHGQAAQPEVHPDFEGRNVGKVCKVHYRGTLKDGTQFDSSYDRGQPLEFTCGAGMMIHGFDKAVADLEVGKVIDVTLPPNEAYGMPDPRLVFAVEIAKMPGAEDCQVGMQVYLSDQSGQPFPVTVVDKDQEYITFDANHQLAGKELNFRIELMEVQ